MAGDANRVDLLYVEEDSYKSPPATPDMQFARITSESLKSTKDTVTSDEIRSDRQIADIIRTGAGVEGDINGELSMETWEDFILAVIGASALSAEVDVLLYNTSGTVEVDATAGTFTHSAGWDTQPTDNQIIRVTGFSNAGNNGFFKVASSTGTVITVSNTGDLVDESSVSNVEIVEGGQALNGTTETSFTFERRHNDLTNVFEQYYGVEFDSMTLEIDSEGVATISFSVMGSEEEATDATIADSTTDANTNQVLSASNNLELVAVDYSGVCMLTGSITIENNLRAIRCAGQLYNSQIGLGSINISGDLELHFDDHTQKDKYLAHTESGLMIALADSADKGMAIEIPAYHITDEETVAEGRDSDLIESISFETKIDATEDAMIRYSVFDAFAGDIT